MGKRSQYQLTGYTSEEEGKAIERAADERDQSVSEFLIEAARRERQRMEIDA